MQYSPAKEFCYLYIVKSRYNIHQSINFSNRFNLPAKEPGNCSLRDEECQNLDVRKTNKFVEIKYLDYYHRCLSHNLKKNWYEPK